MVNWITERFMWLGIVKDVKELGSCCIHHNPLVILLFFVVCRLPHVTHVKGQTAKLLFHSMAGISAKIILIVYTSSGGMFCHWVVVLDHWVVCFVIGWWCFVIGWCALSLGGGAWSLGGGAWSLGGDT